MLTKDVFMEAHFRHLRNKKEWVKLEIMTYLSHNYNIYIFLNNDLLNLNYDFKSWKYDFLNRNYELQVKIDITIFYLYMHIGHRIVV